MTLPHQFRPTGTEFALLVVVLLLKGVFALRFPGFLTGDDLEIVQTVGKYAWHLDYHPWALRSFFHPLVLAYPIPRLAVLAGASDPRLLSALCVLPTAVFSTVSIYLTRLVALSLGCDSRTSTVAAWLYATHWLPLGYGGTQYPRPISTCFLLAAFVLVQNQKRSVYLFVAGVLSAAAFAVRWTEALVLIPLLGWAYLRQRQPRLLVTIAAGFAVGVILFVGALDWATWGSPFSSLSAFLQIMGAEGLVYHKPDPPYWYVLRVLHWAGPVLVVLGVAAAADRRSRLPLVTAGFIITVLSCSPLKALRYTQAAIPFLCILASLGWLRLSTGTLLRRRIATATLLIAPMLGIERSITLLRDKSQSAILAAQFLAPHSPRRIALEQSWAYGERLYLGNRPEIESFEPVRPLPPVVLKQAGSRADAIGVYTRDLTPEGRHVLRYLGFEEVGRFQRDRSKECTLFLKQDGVR